MEVRVIYKQTGVTEIHKLDIMNTPALGSKWANNDDYSISLIRHMPALETSDSYCEFEIDCLSLMDN